MGHGPQQSAALGQKDPSVKSPCTFILIPRIPEFVVNIVKCISCYLFIRKLCMIYQNAQ
jgi:hypothetical protein